MTEIKPEFVFEPKYGFWKQTNPQPFDYSLEYKQSQSTNTDMSFLRIGWISAFLPHALIRKISVVDIGSGNGTFVNVGKNVFGSCCGYDVNGESITREELYAKHWDMVVLSDVLEHFEDIEDLFKMKWEFCFVSFPETPKVKSAIDLESWRHYKPNEHLWCLNVEGMIRWFEDHRCRVVGSSSVEDVLRRRWDDRKPNISSVLVNRDKIIL
jgi:hypothetical protein